MATSIEKIPPQDVEAEQSLLGAMMISSLGVAQVVGKVKPDYFYRIAHSHIFNAILSLYKSNQPIDLVTISAELKKANKLDESGGRSYLSEVIDSVPTAANIEKYADIVSEKAMLRKLIDAGSEIVAKAFDETQEVADVLESAQHSILEISREQVQDDFVKLKDILMPVMDSIESVYDNENKILGIPTGYKDLDDLTSGLQKSDMIILAARPSMGKTTLALNIALNSAVHYQKSVAMFSCEMPKEQLAMRLLSSESKINSSRLKTANILEQEYKDLSRALGRLSEANIYIDDTPAISPLEMRAKCRRLAVEGPIDLVIIDYLQLMRLGKSKIESRFQEVSTIVREIKSFARELQVPVIALSQLSRAIEQRQDKRPMLSDLRESGEIEQTADLVMFIHRDDYYEASKEPVSPTELIIAKHRNGPTGSVKLSFRRDVSRFYNAESRPTPTAA